MELDLYAEILDCLDMWVLGNLVYICLIAGFNYKQ